ncbi:MAG: M42 family metallopeptidase [Candidatus Bathyarchaeia archaeon]
MDLNLLAKLSNAFGPPGHEEEPRNILRETLESIADETNVDRLGNIFFYHLSDKSKATVMLAAHTDEVAFLVTHIGENGFLRFHTLGGIPDREMPGQRLIFKGKNGPVHGIIGTKPPHIMKDEEKEKVVPREDLFIDVGASSQAEAEEKGCFIGMTGVFDVSYMDLGNGYVRGKAFDDRAGCFVMSEVFKKLKDSDVNLVAVGTVQEEVGLRGAKTAAWQVYPSYGLALEGTFAADVPGSKPHQTSAGLEKGPVITIADRTVIAHPQVLNTLIEVAEERDISYQFKKIPSGGTDAGSIHLVKGGVPSGTVACPCRYIHGPAAITTKDDLRNTINLVTGFIEHLSV